MKRTISWKNATLVLRSSNLKVKKKKKELLKNTRPQCFTWQIMCNLLAKSYIYLKNIVSEDKSTAKFPKELRVEWEMGGRSETFQSSQGSRM